MVEQFQPRLLNIGSKRFLFIWLEKSFLSFKLFLLGSKKNSREKSCLPSWFTINILHGYPTESILLPAKFLTEWTFLEYCKTSNFFFWLIFLASSPPSLTAVRFPHSSSINTSLGGSSKSPMSSLSIQSSSSWTIRIFSEGLLFWE